MNYKFLLLLMCSVCMNLCIPLVEKRVCNKNRLPRNDQLKCCVQHRTSGISVKGRLDKSKHNSKVGNNMKQNSQDQKLNKISRQIVVCLFMVIFYMVTLFVFSVKEIYLNGFIKVNTTKLKANARQPKENDFNEACSICLENYRPGKLISEFESCEHKFHYHCIETWFKIQNTCPLCRAKLV